ncbi:EAL domain-containing protein [Amycolatopsis plumensis]|uniref:EAL domain-containing protein n=1 Tax=Amycolatopsis plumensis TaxID=236508 RepID=A0ABV5U441_9PSEU
MNGDDHALLEHCARTPEELAEYQQFFRDNRGKLLWHVKRIIPGHDHVLVADEALVRVWATWRQPEGPRLAWAMSIATNLARDVLRRTREFADEVLEDTVPLWTTPVDAEQHFELRETLQYAAEELPPRQFAAILLQVLGYTTVEVTEKVGAQSDSVRRYRSDGRKKLEDWRACGRPQPRTGPGRRNTSMNPSTFQHLSQTALQQLRSRLLRALPGDKPAVPDGSLPKPAAIRPLTDGDIVLRLAQRGLIGGQFAHFDPTALPLTLHTAGPADVCDGAVDEDFLALADAARTVPGGTVVVVVRLPDRTAAGPLSAAEVEQLHAAAAERVAATLGDPGEVRLGSHGPDLLALVPGRLIGQDLQLRLSRLADALADPVPIAGRHAPVRAHLALVPLAADADIPTALALQSARTRLPGPGPLTWMSPVPAADGPRGDLTEQAELLLRARAAIAAGRFVLLYRDIHSIGEPGVAGGRAVPAWIDTDGTEHTFTELDAIADATGLTREVFDHMLPALCRDLLLWRAARRRSTPHVLLEVPEQLLRERYLTDRLAAVLQAGPVPPSLLILGIPAAALATVEGIDEHLHQLSDVGVQLAITGYGDTHTPLAVLTRRRWNLAVLPHTVLAKLEDRHPDGVDAERAVMQALVHTADQLQIRLLADNTALPVARRYLFNGLHIPPRAPITAVELSERSWIELPDFPPERPEPGNFSAPSTQPRHAVPAQRADR